MKKKNKTYLRITIELLFFAFFILIFNYYYQYPNYLHKSVIISKYDILHEFFLSQLKNKYTSSPVQFNIKTNDIEFKLPDIENSEENIICAKIDIPSGFLKTHINLFKIASIFDFKINFLNNMQFKSSFFGYSWASSINEKMIKYNNKFYHIDNGIIIQIYKQTENELIPLSPETSKAFVDGNKIILKKKGYPVKIFEKYNGNKFILKEVKTQTNYCHFNYDKSGKLISITDKDNNKCRFFYNNSGLIKKIEFNSKQYLFSYDSKKHLKHIKVNGFYIAIDYKKNENDKFFISKISSPSSDIMFDFDIFGRLKTVVNNGKIVELKYFYNRIKILTDNILYFNIILNSDNSMLIKNEHSKNNILIKNKGGKIIFYKDEKNELSYFYSGDNLKKEKSNKDIYNFEYDKKYPFNLISIEKNSKLIYKTRKLKNKKIITYLDDEYELVYDESGKLKKIKKNNFELASIIYDNYGNIIKVSYPDKSSTSFLYKKNGLIFSILNRFLNKFVIQHNNFIFPNGKCIKLNKNIKILNFNGKKIRTPFISSNICNIDFLHNTIGCNIEYFGKANIVLRNDSFIKKIIFNEDFEININNFKNNYTVETKKDNLIKLYFKKKKDIKEKNTALLFIGKEECIKSIENKNKITVFYGNQPEIYTYDSKKRLLSIKNKTYSVKFDYLKDGSIYSIKYPDKSEIKYEYDKSGYIKNIYYENYPFAKYEVDEKNKTVNILYFNKISEKIAYDENQDYLKEQLITKDNENILNVFYSYDNDILTCNLNRYKIVYDFSRDNESIFSFDKSKRKYTFYENGIIKTNDSESKHKSYKISELKNNRILIEKDNSKSLKINSINVFGKIFGKNMDYIELNNTAARIKNDYFVFKNLPVNYKHSTAYEQDDIMYYETPYILNAYTKSGGKETTKYYLNVVDGASAIISFLNIPYVDYVAYGGKYFNFKYDSFLRPKEIEDGRNKIKFQYNADNTLRSIKTKNKLITFIYDSFKNPIAILDNYGNLTKFIYDYQRKILIGIINKNNVLYTVHKDIFGNTILICDSSGKAVSEYIYSPYGEFIKKSETISPIFYLSGFYFIKSLNLYFDLKTNRIYSPKFAFYFMPKDFYKKFYAPDFSFKLEFKNKFPNKENSDYIFYHPLEIQKFGTFEGLTLKDELFWVNFLDYKKYKNLYRLYNTL